MPNTDSLATAFELADTLVRISEIADRWDWNTTMPSKAISGDAAMQQICDILNPGRGNG